MCIEFPRKIVIIEPTAISMLACQKFDKWTSINVAETKQVNRMLFARTCTLVKQFLVTFCLCPILYQFQISISWIDCFFSNGYMGSHSCVFATSDHCWCFHWFTTGSITGWCFCTFGAFIDFLVILAGLAVTPVKIDHWLSMEQFQFYPSDL